MRFVDPIDIFDRIVVNIRPASVFKIIRMTVCSEYIQCFRHVLQRFKTYHDELIQERYDTLQTPSNLERIMDVVFSDLNIEEMRKWLRDKPKFALIYKEFFP